MPDLKSFFGKDNSEKKSKKQKKDSKVILVKSDSDEEPIPVNISRSRKRRQIIISDEDVEEVKFSNKSKEAQHKPKKSKTAKTEDLYESIKSVETSDLHLIDPASYFSKSQISHTKICETSPSLDSGKKRKISAATQPAKISNRDDDIFVDGDEHEKHTPKKGFTEESKKKFIQALQREPPKMLGLRSLPVGKANCLNGLSFVITGILEYIERDEAISLVQRYGGRVTTSVSGRTSYLVVGRDPGESKMKKAHDVKTPILNEDEFFNLISESKDYIDESFSLETTHLGSSIMEELMPEPNVTSELWVEKYKPTTVDHIIGQHGPKSPANKLLQWLSNWQKNRESGSNKNYFASKEDGSIFKAALISGSPGIGKSTAALLCCKQLGFDAQELNASDMRNKNCLDTILSVSLENFKLTSSQITVKSVLIMDEVDGMSGNEDRGGIQHLISFVKTTQIPIICICNDRNHPKIRSLSNHCYDLRFPKPRVDIIKNYILSIAEKERLNIEPQAAEQIVIAAHNDIRQIINNLQMWSCSKKKLGYDDAKEEAFKSEKDIKESVFDVVRKIFTKSVTSKMNLMQKADLFFFDYSFIPLFVFENYPLTILPPMDPTHDHNPKSSNEVKNLSRLARCADSLSCGAICETYIRTFNSWSLLPTQALFSCVIPSEYVGGALRGQINFPKFLGNNSTTSKNRSIVRRIVDHTSLKCHSSTNSMVLDYLPYFHHYFYDPLVENDSEAVEQVIAKVIDYDLIREDFDSICEFAIWMSDNKKSNIPTKTKASFTRNFNKISRQLPFSTVSTSSQKIPPITNDQFEDTEDEINSSDEVESKQIDNMIRPVKTPSTVKPTAKKTQRKVKTK